MMRGLFVTAVLIAVGVVAVVVADDKVCLPDKNQFTYYDGLTVVIDHGLGLVGQQYKDSTNRWVMKLKTNQNNLFHIKEEGSVTKCISYRTSDHSPYPRCTDPNRLKLINSNLEYLFYADSKPSKVVARSITAFPVGVSTWDDKITDKKLLEIPTECNLRREI